MEDFLASVRDTISDGNTGWTRQRTRMLPTISCTFRRTMSLSILSDSSASTSLLDDSDLNCSRKLSANIHQSATAAQRLQRRIS